MPKKPTLRAVSIMKWIALLEKLDKLVMKNNMVSYCSMNSLVDNEL